MNQTQHFREAFDSYLPSRTVRKAATSAVLSCDSINAVSFEEHMPAVPAQEHGLQQLIRPWFGKTGTNHTPIGPHPDFAHLAGSDETQFQHVTTLFVDIENSTRLSLLYDLPTVVSIKNAILRAASEIVRALDGHVHRFMGDALMAFFGRADVSKEDSALAAVNCAAVLRLFMEESVIPGLERHGIDARDLGFRVGIDYGDDDQVVWASYGYNQVHEVTATSFHVDVAAKLQARASRNQVMFGANLLDHLDFPDQFVQIKTRQKNGESISIPHLVPNLTKADGTPLNYRIREFLVLGYAQLLPFPRQLKSTFSGFGCVDHPAIDFRAFARESGELAHYPSLSRCLDKHVGLTFSVYVKSHGFQFNYPLKVVFTKTNYGKEATAKTEAGETVAGTRYLTPTKSEVTRLIPSLLEASIPESTAYRGIHTMKAEVFDSNSRLIFRDIIGVHIR